MRKVLRVLAFLVGFALLGGVGAIGLMVVADRAGRLYSGRVELAFGAALDGWTRTYRGKAYVVAPAGGVISRGGLTVLASDRLPSFSRRVTLAQKAPIEAMLDEVEAAYGRPTARFVALQLEHPRWAGGF